MSRGGDTRFQKGQSGNPGGRPKKRRPNVSAFDIIFDKTLTVTQGGVERELTIDEALQLQTYQAALKGSRMAIRQVLKMIEKREVALAKKEKPVWRGAKMKIEHSSTNANEALRILDIAPYDPSWGVEHPRMRMTLWATQAALSRPGRRRFSERDAKEHQVLHERLGSAEMAAGQFIIVSEAQSDELPDDAGEPAGYGRPPRATRFRKGQSGNPGGRPRGRRNEIPYNSVLGQMVTIREDGRERRITAAEAFLLQLTQKGLAGDGTAARALLDSIEAARAKQQHYHAPQIDTIRVSIINEGIETVLAPLGIAVKKCPLDEERVRWELQPWIIEAALERLGQKQLASDEQQEVWNNARTPEKVHWPDWWTFRG